LGAQNSVGRAQLLCLVKDAAFGSDALGQSQQILLGLAAKVANDEGNFFDFAFVRSSQIFHKSLHYWFSRNRNQRFGNGKAVWAQACTSACHRDNYIHFLGLMFNLIPAILALVL
jgi:hypothetical protein